VLSNPRNLRYFTAYEPLLSVSPTRPWYAVVPQVGEPVLCVPALAELDARDASWVTFVHTWPSPNVADEGRSSLLSVLGDLALSNRRIGLEAGHETRTTMPITDLDAVRAALAHVAFIDASCLLWRLRMTKDVDEIRCMQRSIDAALSAFQRIAVSIDGQSKERQLANLFSRHILEGGADLVGYLAVGSGPRGYRSLTRAASDRVVARDDVLGLDVGAISDGYWCDFDRNIVAGAAHSDVERAHASLEATIQAGFATCRAGMPVCDVRASMNGAMRSEGYAVSLSGRWGHGVGLDFTEPPSLTMCDQTLLQPGMVITLEPLLMTEDGSAASAMLIAEEMVLITEGAPLMLTRKEVQVKP
jgi:Xaa-Pro dipeptidase